MNGLLQDLRYALRQLRKNPGFTAVATLTLALGIGANTAIFTIVNALLLKMLPATDPGQLVVLGDPAQANQRNNGTPRTDVFSYPLYREFRDGNSTFTEISAAATDHHVALDASQVGVSELAATVRMVSGNYFTLLGLKPAAGRLFSDSDDTTEGANPVAVLSYSYWRSKFALNPSIVGSKIDLNGYPFTVVGVAPARFDGDVVGEQMAMFVPLSMQSQIIRGRHWLRSGNQSWLSLMGRLRSGVSLTQAEANLNVVFRRALQSDYGANLSSDDRNAIHDAHIAVFPGGTGVSELRANYKKPLLVLMGIVGLILLIACVNVASLLLARAATRSREVAVRLAIGASRSRLLRQLLTESVFLAFIGGSAGSVFAVLGVRILLRTLGDDISLQLSPDAPALAFSIGISLLTGVFFGLVPALRTLNASVSPALKDAGKSATGTRLRFGWGKGLIAGQVAIALLVLFAACILVRSLQKLMAQDFGYRRDHLVVARLDPTSVGYNSDKMKALAEGLTSRISSVPGVRAATYSTNGLFAHSESSDALLVPGFETKRPGDRGAREDYVGPGYFSTVGIPILAGRGIEAQDTPASTRVATVNEAMANHFFPGQNPIGRQFRVDDPDWRDKPITIVGISRNAQDHGSGLREPVKPRFYLAYQQMPDPIQIVVEARIEGDPATALTNVTNQIKAVDPSLPISFVETLDSLVADSARDQIALAKLATFFAALALLLACIGLYGVLAYMVAARTREIGVRMALGAGRGHVVRLVAREGLLLVAIGMAMGTPLALAASRLLRSFLFGLTSTDPLSLVTVFLTLGLVALVASVIPARRAARIDPMVALRYE